MSFIVKHLKALKNRPSLNEKIWREQEEAKKQRKNEEGQRGQGDESRWQEKKKEEDEARQQAEPVGIWSNRTVKDEEYFKAVLELQRRITPEEIKRRYRELVAQYHPAKVAHLGPKLKEAAEQEMKEINEAYDFFKRKHGLQ